MSERHQKYYDKWWKRRRTFEEWGGAYWPEHSKNACSSRVIMPGGFFLSLELNFLEKITQSVRGHLSRSGERRGNRWDNCHRKPHWPVYSYRLKRSTRAGDREILCLHCPFFRLFLVVVGHGRGVVAERERHGFGGSLSPC